MCTLISDRTPLWLVIAAAMPLLMPSSSFAEEYRQWADRTGQFHVEATLVNAADGSVSLKRRDGRIITVLYEKLSHLDQKYINTVVSVPLVIASNDRTDVCNQLTQQIVESYKSSLRDNSKPKIAVLNFSNGEGGSSPDGVRLCEEMVTKLFLTGKFDIQERLLLDRVMEEHRLSEQGFVGPKSAERIGMLLGVDAILTGTICEVGKSRIVNARLISTETGQIASVASATLGPPVLQIRRASSELAHKLVSTYDGAERLKVAVVGLSGLSGKAPMLGRVLSEETLTQLFRTGRFDVVEKLLIDVVRSEHKLGDDGFLNLKAIKEIGTELEVDAIVAGTSYIDDGIWKVNVRLISTTTGAIMAVAGSSIDIDSQERSPVAKATEGERFKEDFSSYKIGDETTWGPNGYVTTGFDKRKWLYSTLDGKHKAGRPVGFGSDFYLQFDYVGFNRGNANQLLYWKTYCSFSSSIALIDKSGMKYRIGWSGAHGGTQRIGLPNGEEGSMESASYGTMRINKLGEVCKIFINGQHVVSGSFAGMSEIVGFEVELFKNGQEFLCVTDFSGGPLTLD